MAAAVSMALSHPAPGPSLDGSVDRSSSLNRSNSRGNDIAPRQSLRRSRGSVESLHKKRVRHARLDSDRLHPKGGQQFRVGNVTSNGRLQLRPVAGEPGSYTSPPITPPYSQTAHGPRHDLQDNWRGSVFSGSTDGTSLQYAAFQESRPLEPLPSAALRLSRARSHSFSTMDDPVEHDRRNPANIKVLINSTSPMQTRTGKTADDTPGLIEVPIPHYRLGTPHFNGRGNAILHSSINTGSSATDGFRSSAFSGQEYDRMFPQPPGLPYRRMSTHAGGYAISKTHYLSIDGAGSQRRPVSSDVLSTTDSHKRVVEPTVLLELEASPLDQDSRALVRLSRTTGQILAATPSGLIAQITSPNLLDYELLSDFFLTFRSYLKTHQLVSSLINRLQWAVSRSDDFGRIVRVRTFVALRHWILNYFVDDFVSDYSLRANFCNLVNDLCDDVKARLDGGAADLNILGELKKCWRRTCALYWDVPEHKREGAADAILPGGRLGSRDSSAAEASSQAALRGPTETTKNLKSGGDFTGAKGGPREIPADGLFSAVLQGKTARVGQNSHNRTSDQSTHVVSCSITFKSATSPNGKNHPSTAARPAVMGTGSVPTSARLSPGLRKNSPPLHRRAGSFSDALRDSRTLEASATGPQPPVTSSHTLSGSLVRGALIQPASPYVESLAPESPAEEKSRFDFNFNGQSDVLNFDDKQRTPPSPGMKKFLGNVRRALSARQNLSQISVVDRKVATMRRSPRVSGIPVSRGSSNGAPKRKLVGGQTRPRVDLLAVMASESFFKLAKETSDTDEPNQTENPTAQTGTSLGDSGDDAYHLSTSPPLESRPLYSNVTMGSRSIVIVDDTGGYPSPNLRPLTQGSKPAKQLRQNSNDPQGRESRQTIAVGVEPESPMATRLLELGVAGIITPPASSVDPHSPALRGATFEPARSSKLKEVSQDLTQDTQDTPTTTADAFHYDRQPQLRRRPGGDLRAVDHVHSLEENSSHRSLGSNQSFPQELSATSNGGPTREQLKSSIVESPSQATKAVSVMDAHSSQPMLRESFEQEAAKLAQIPDDEDDGGIESTLRKLEGEIRSSGSGLFDETTNPAASPQAKEAIIQPTSVAGDGRSRKPVQARHPEEGKQSSIGLSDAKGMSEDADQSKSTRLYEEEGENDQGSRPISVAESAHSYSSTPLLERGTSYVAPKKRHSSSDWLKVSLPKSAANSPTEESGPFQRFGTRTDHGLRGESVDSLEQISRDLNMPQSSSTHKSFLLDDDQSLNGGTNENRSSNVQRVSSGNRTKSFLNDDDDENLSTGGDGGVLPHPLRHPDTPPRERSSPFAPRQSPAIVGPSLAGHITQRDRDAFSSRSSPSRAAHSRNAIELQNLPPPPALAKIPAAAHIPFILAHDSLLLAQQFTLVEKDALSEIDWRQLINLRWNTNAKTCRTWSDCLKPQMLDTKEQRFMGGVDICITRFNIVVKWATSEIVLCQDVADRVACIVKYIHVARFARQLRNWSTMFQITMALVSADVTRLKHTWSEVPERDREYLKELETLITPTRNFHNLREEIEDAVAGPPAPGTDGGCIPFIGIYTHDLIYNAQKPAYAQPPEGVETSEPLINFERHRTASTIVKSLLRLVDASSKYPFQPVPEVLSRCLWMATLGDEDISQRSKSVESGL